MTIKDLNMDTFELAAPCPKIAMFPKTYCRQVYTSGRNTAGSHNSRNSRIATANWIECLMCLCFMDSAGWLFIKDSIAHAWLPGDGHVSSCKNLLGFQPSWFWSSHKRGYFTHCSLQCQSWLKVRQAPPSLLVWGSFWKSFKYYVIILRGFSQRDYGNVLDFEGYPGVEVKSWSPCYELCFS